MQPTQIHSYIPTLNGWRALSILYVLLFHGTWIYFNPKTGLYANEKIWHITNQGGFGVFIFFGISGYLITTRLVEENNFFGNISIRAFYWRRIFRIIPILMVFLSVITALKFSGVIQISSTAILSSIFFFRNYIQDASGWYTAHFWSLSMEEHYYLIWPLLFFFIIRLKKPWLPMLFILASVIVWRFLEFRYHFLSPYISIEAFSHRTDMHFDYILWGSLTAYLNMQTWFKKIFYQLAREWMIYFSFVIVHLLLFISIPLSDTLKAVFIQICILLTINFPRSAFSKLLENKIISKVGIYSYSLYVWQQLVFPPADERLGQFAIFQTPPINIILICILAYISFNYLETPAINFGKKFLNKINLSR